MENLILSITTIGDLLLRQTITNGEEPIKGVSLCVPIYQRPYKWTARNAIQLLDDIIDAKNSNKERYRVGTLILHKVNGKNQKELMKNRQLRNYHLLKRDFNLNKLKKILLNIKRKQDEENIHNKY